MPDTLTEKEEFAIAKLKIGVFGAGRGQTMVGQILGSTEAEPVPDAIYDEVRRRWLAGEPG